MLDIKKYLKHSYRWHEHRGRRVIGIRVRPSSSGFTLIEVMIVVVIIGILAAIAYPLYVDQVQRSHRSTAQSELLAYAQAMERCFTTERDYQECTNVYAPDIDTDRYAVEVGETGSGSFVISAEPIGPQADDDCGTMTINQRGATAPDDCWN